MSTNLLSKNKNLYKYLTTFFINKQKIIIQIMHNQNIWNRSLQAKRSAFAVSIRNQNHKIKLAQLRQTYTLLTQNYQFNIIQKLPATLNLLCHKIRTDSILQLELINRSEKLASLISASNFDDWKLFCLLIGDLIIFQPDRCDKIISTCIQIILMKGVYFINQMPLFRVTIQDSINQILKIINPNIQCLNNNTIEIIVNYLKSILIIIEQNSQYQSIEFQQFISIVGLFVVECDQQNSKLLLFVNQFFDRIIVQKFISWLSYDMEEIVVNQILNILINVTYLFNSPDQIKLIEPVYAFCYIRCVLVQKRSTNIKKLAVMLLNNILLFNSSYISQAFDFGLIYLIVTLAQHFVGTSEFYDEAIYTICASILNLKQNNIQTQMYLKNFSQTQGLQIIFDYLNRDPVVDSKLMILQTIQRLAMSQKDNDRLIKLISYHEKIIEELINNQNEEISKISRDLLDLINVN